MNFIIFIYINQVVEKYLKENKKTEKTKEINHRLYKDWHKQQYNPYFDYTFNNTNNSNIKK